MCVLPKALLLFATMLLVVACGGTTGATPLAHGSGASGDEHPVGANLYGDSTVTPLAREMTARALELDETLAPVAFLLRFEVGLADDETASRPVRALRFGVVVTRDGLRIVELSARDRTSAVEWRGLSELGELRPIALELVEDVRTDRIDDRRLAERDRETLGDEAFDALRGLAASDGSVVVGEQHPVAARIVDMALLTTSGRGGVHVVEIHR